VIAEPHICGGIPIDETFYALVLMSDGIYRSIEEAADIETNSNFDVVRMVTEELHCQNNLTGVAQAVVDRIGRAHHDTYMNQMCKCQKRDDMTLLIRIFKEEIAHSMKSPRATGRQVMTGIVGGGGRGRNLGKQGWEVYGKREMRGQQVGGFLRWNSQGGGKGEEWKKVTQYWVVFYNIKGQRGGSHK